MHRKSVPNDLQEPKNLNFFKGVGSKYSRRMSRLSGFLSQLTAENSGTFFDWDLFLMDFP
jgi:hypothetical protein